MAADNDQKVIMVVEPDVLIRMVIAEYLRECGYKVIEGAAAKDAWAVLESGRRIDVMMADVNLSGDIGGFSLATRVRQTHPNIDVILTSGIAGASQESHQLCDDGPIRKPYHPKDVERRIKILLGRRRASTKP